MDKGAERIAQDMKNIVQTRVAIAEKFGAIEQHVYTTMQHAKTTMTELADKTTSSVRDTMKVTKETLDPRVHVTRHPWVSVGGAVVLGYAVTAISRRGRRSTTGIVPYYPLDAKGAAVKPATLMVVMSALASTLTVCAAVARDRSALILAASPIQARATLLSRTRSTDPATARRPGVFV